MPHKELVKPFLLVIIIVMNKYYFYLLDFIFFSLIIDEFLFNFALMYWVSSLLTADHGVSKPP